MSAITFTQEQEAKLYRWMKMNFLLYCMNKLSQEKIDMLNAMQGESWLKNCQKQQGITVKRCKKLLADPTYRTLVINDNKRCFKENNIPIKALLQPGLVF